jgi:hypothetical protein
LLERKAFTIPHYLLSTCDVFSFSTYIYLAN